MAALVTVATTCPLKVNLWFLSAFDSPPRATKLATDQTQTCTTVCCDKGANMEEIVHFEVASCKRRRRPGPGLWYGGDKVNIKPQKYNFELAY